MKKKLISAIIGITMIAIAAVGCSKPSNDSKDTSKEKSNVKAEQVDAKKVFVSPQWVQSVIDKNQPDSKNYIIGEVSWGTYKDSPTYTKGHIPGAIHIDTSSVESEPIWNISDPKLVEKNMLDLGITKDKTVILYGNDISAVSRVAYAYLWAGVENVKVLNGGIEAWEKDGYKTETKVEKPTPAKDFGTTVPAHPEYWMSIDQVQKKLKDDSNFRLVSIRSKEEFDGKTSGYTYIDRAGEPKGAVWGHAGSDPYNMQDYLHKDGTVITAEEMEKLWSDSDINKNNELSFYCGTGWRAAVPWLIAYDAGWKNMTVYDGGWNEWQMHNNLPVQVGDPNGGNCEYTTVGKLPTDKAAKK
ncbi:rhodanese domain-containing protein [[Clostridium] sordellii]|uniref:rhodanese-like domain-containing protein n=1 Tax=Paraclostridium sordellii TaxID=1505 RepID=UPI0005DF2E11|nr:rhodanese-like domain-containing protein [Paeniclostridium sordellii]CEN91765.1 rhodanese domain-containing protein [[Clostridium] sordellii] [Paeniclostridium sordellii]